MAKLTHLGFAIFFIFITACKQQAAKNGVTIKNTGVFNPVTFELEGGTNRGEFLIGSDPVEFTLRVNNNSEYELTSAIMTIDEDSTAAMKFSPDPLGKSYSPGYGGSCFGTIAAKSTCTYKITYSPTFPGSLSQKFTFDYKNLVESGQITAQASLVAGEAASLIFVSDKVNYNFGIVERTERSKIIETLTIKNAGGLTARNITKGEIYTPDSGAYTITSYNCPSELAQGQQCSIVMEFEPMNYDAGAPDGTAEVNYTASVKLDYTRDPQGGTSALNAYFSVLSTTIEGKILSSGLSNIEFENLTVGNVNTKIFKVQNQGYKEAILHRIDVLNAGGTVVGSCIKPVSGGNLECRDPADISNPSAKLTLEQLPLKFLDVSGCINEHSKLSYSRDADGVLSDLSLKQVAGKTDEIPGEACFFNITFHPSVAYTSDGNINNYTLKMVYDTTWKNNIVMVGGSSDPSQFVLAKANYYSAAKFDIGSYEYNNTTFSNIDPDDDGMYLYDVGRVALISSSVYKSPIKVVIKNTGGTVGEVVSIKDGNTTPFTFTDTANNINSYYLNATHLNCTSLNPVAGQCDLKMDLAPVASTNPDSNLAQAEENANMYDSVAAYPDRYKKFIIEYKDGTSIEDDGTARANRKVEVWTRALLVRKGYLVFEDISPAQGTGIKAPAGNTEFFHVKLKNAGTGGIPYISALSGFSLEGTSEKSSNQPFPYEIVNRAGGEDGADLDCYDFMLFNEPAPTPVAPLTNAASVLDAGKSCSLTVKMKLRDVDRYLTSDYSVSFKDWNRPFYSVDQNDAKSWEYSYYNRPAQNISFKYYDGDGIEDVPNSYFPTQAGYGNYYTIAGGTTGQYKMEITFQSEGRIIPTKPKPMVTAVICRDTITLPAIPLGAGDWGSTISSDSVTENCADFHDKLATTPISHYLAAETNLKASENGYDYVYYGGTFKVGGIYKGSFTLSNMGTTSLTDISESYTGPNTVEIVKNDSYTGGSKEINFTFTPSGTGSFSTDYEISFKNGRKSLDNESTLSYSDIERTFKIKIVFDAVAATEGEFTLTGKDYLVTYDPDTDTTDDTTPIAGSETITLPYNEIASGEYTRLKAIRGSEVYAKKILTLTNSGANTINNINFSIKASVDASSTQNSKPGVGYSIVQNNCFGTSLNSGANCTIELRHKASVTEPLQTTAYGNITYEMGSTGLYQQRNFEIRFQASNPAILAGKSLFDENIKDEADKIIEDSFILNVGTYAGSHPIISNFPSHRVSFNGIEVENLSSEKASFLSQWDEYSGGAPLPGDAFIEIFNSGGRVVEANRACFYGDDEFDGGVPTNQKGFMDTSGLRCLMNFHLDLKDDFLGVNIDPAYSYIPLKYFNNERAGTDQIYFHFKGFVEPNRSTMASTAIFNVTSTDSGVVSFEWNPATPTASPWGSINGYRVYYSTTSSILSSDKIFTGSGMSYVDTTDPNVTISGLGKGKYYYFRVLAKRSTSTPKNYISSMSMPVQTVVVPPSGYFYDYITKVIVSKNLSSVNGGFGTKSEAAAACSSDSVILTKNGTTKSYSLTLINSSIHALIDSDASNSSYDHKSIPHWLNDASTDVSLVPEFSTGFDCTVTTGIGTDNHFYQKSCSDCTCNSLSKMIGGDGGEIPYGATLFVEPESFSGVYRCYINQ